MKKTALLFLSFIFLLSSCIKEEFNPNLLSTNLTISPVVAVPIGYMDLTLDKYLADSLRPEQLTTDANGFFTLLYHQPVASLNASDILKFDQQLQKQSALNNTSGADLDFNLIPTSFILYDTLKINLNFKGGQTARIDSALLKTLFIELKVNSAYSLSGDLQVTIPQLTKNGSVYSKSTTINGFNTSAQIVNYKLSPEFKNDSNIVELCFKATINKSAAIVPNNAELINYSFSLADINYSVIYGYLGQQTITIPEQMISLPFFEKITDGSFHFESPKLKLMFENSFGFPISLGFDKFEANTRRNGVMTVSGASFPTTSNRLDIKYPSLQQIGETVNDSLILNSSNTNLFQMLEALPTSLNFSAQATSNLNTSSYNFITDTSKLNVDVQLELPLYGYASFLLVQDTMDFQLSDFYDAATQKIKKMSFTLDFVNSFPVQIDAQIYFCDQNHLILDSMFTLPFSLQGGIDMNGDGKTDPTMSNVTTIEIDSAKLERIKDTKYLLNRGRIHTTNSDNNPPMNVKFYNDYSLRANLGAIFEFEEFSTSSLKH